MEERAASGNAIIPGDIQGSDQTLLYLGSIRDY